MLFREAINNCCKDVSQNKPYLINKCCNYSIKFNLNASIHVLTPKSAGRQPTQKSYKITFFFEKNVVNHTIFAGRPTNSVGLIVCTSFILEPPYLAIRTSLYISLII